MSLQLRMPGKASTGVTSYLRHCQAAIIVSFVSISPRCLSDTRAPYNELWISLRTHNQMIRTKFTGLQHQIFFKSQAVNVHLSCVLQLRFAQCGVGSVAGSVTSGLLGTWRMDRVVGTGEFRESSFKCTALSKFTFIYSSPCIIVLSSLETNEIVQLIRCR
jgi:hypothetical protein